MTWKEQQTVWALRLSICELINLESTCALAFTFAVTDACCRFPLRNSPPHRGSSVEHVWMYQLERIWAGSSHNSCSWSWSWKTKKYLQSTNFIHQKVPWNKTTEEWEATLWVNNNMAVMMEPKQYKCHTTAKRFPQCKTAAQISGLMPI